jgi:excisionase family DNA binding protein
MTLPTNAPGKRRKKARPALDPLDTLQRYSVEEAAAYLRHSRWAVYRDLREGRLLAIREGHRTFIPGTEIARLSRIEPAP